MGRRVYKGTPVKKARAIITRRWHLGHHLLSTSYEVHGMYSVLSTELHEDGWARAEDHLVESVEGVLVTIYEVDQHGSKSQSDFIFTPTGLEPWSTSD
mgnify:CR=1 FL=1